MEAKGIEEIQLIVPEGFPLDEIAQRITLFENVFCRVVLGKRILIVSTLDQDKLESFAKHEAPQPFKPSKSMKPSVQFKRRVDAIKKEYELI